MGSSPTDETNKNKALLDLKCISKPETDKKEWPTDGCVGTGLSSTVANEKL